MISGQLHSSDTVRQILIVDDDEDQLAVRQLLLQARGFRTIVAHDAASALALAQGQQPDCALLDLHLPTEAAGLSLLRSLQALPVPPRVVILTGRNVQRLSAQQDLSSVDAIVEKGCSSNILLQVLHEVCDKPT